MKTLGLVLVATLMALPTPARGEPERDATEAAGESQATETDDEAEAPDEAGADPAMPAEADSDAEADADEEVAVDREGDALDEDDRVEVHGLVYEFFIEDDGEKTQLGIEAAGADYLVRAGGAAGALAKQLGRTVTARGWTRPDDSGDTWILVEGFQIEE